ncbi:MAG: PKD domain-containing protein, partial [Bacteroidales bacterium]|nr:PKD domain-containing protein [Bacteroidales bacterium]
NAIFPDQYSVWERVTAGATLEDVHANKLVIEDLTKGDNIFRYSIKNGSCSRTITVNIFNAQLEVKAGMDEPTCTGSYKFAASRVPYGCEGYWSYDRTNSNATIDNMSSPTAKVTNLGRGKNTFVWTVIQNGCVSTDEVVITNNAVTKATVEADQTVCDGATTLTGNPINEKYETGKWLIVRGHADLDIYNPKTEASNFDRGMNVLRWTISSKDGGCSSSADLTITNIGFEVHAGEDFPICSPQTTLSAKMPQINGLWSGEWTGVAGKGEFTFSDPTNPTTSVGGLQHGDNYLVWSVSINNGRCVSRDTIIVSNNTPKLVSDATNEIAGPDQIDLTANHTTMSAIAVAEGFGEGTWTLVMGGGSISESEKHNPNARITNLAQGTSTFRWTVKNKGCEISDDVKVTFGSVTPAEAGDNVYNLCGDVYKLAANGPFNGIGRWRVVEGGGQFDDVSDPRTTVRGLNKGKNVLEWSITYNSGVMTDLVEIWNLTVTDSYAGEDRTICSYEFNLQGNEPKEKPYDMVKLNGQVQHIESTVEWRLISGSCTFSAEGIEEGAEPRHQRCPIVNNLMQGNNTFIYRISNEICTSTDTITVKNDMADKAWACGVDNVCEELYTCDGTKQLNPNSPRYGKGYWMVASGGSGKFIDNFVYDLGQGENTLIWRIETEKGGECNSESQVKVINNQPSEADAGPDNPLAVCGSTSILSGNKPMYFTEAYWELIEGGGQFVNPNPTGEDDQLVDRITLYRNDGTENQTVTVTGLAFGNNRFRWVVKNGECMTSDETVLNNIFIKSEAGNVAPLCADSVQLTANNPSPGIGRWSIKAGEGRGSFDDPTDPHTMVRNLGNGRNVLLWTVNYLDCPSVDEVVVINNEATAATITGGFQQLCDVDATILSAGELAVDATGDFVETGHWDIAEGGGSILFPDQASTPVRDIPFNKNGNRYRWTVKRVYKESVTCVSSADVVVEYNKVVANAGKDQPICDDRTILQANDPGAAEGSWSIVGAASAGTFENSNNPNTKVVNLARGQNILRWTTTYKGCSDYDDVIITNGKPSIPHAGGMQTLCSDYTTLDAYKPEVGYGEWEVIMGKAEFRDSTDARSYVELGKGENVFRWKVTQKTDILVGVDENGEESYDVLTCVLYDDVHIQNNKPDKPQAGTDEAVCSNEFELKAVTPTYGEGIWTIVEEGGGKIANPTSPRTRITNLAYGRTTLEWKVSVNGMCSESDRITLTNFTPTKSDAGPDDKDCSDCRVLDANTPIIGEGHWETVSGTLNDAAGIQSFDNPLDPKSKVCNLIFGENKFLWVIENIGQYDGASFKCQSIDTVSVWNLIPDMAAAGDDMIRCKDNTFMNANVPSIGKGTWRLLQGQGEIIDSLDAKTEVVNLGYGENIFRWTITYGNCTTESDVVVYCQKADPYAGENDVTFEDWYILNAGNPGRLSGYWTYLGSSKYIQFADSTDYHTKVTGLSKGVNTFRWTIETDDCKVYDEVSIVYKTIPVSGFTVDVSSGCYPLTVRFSDESMDATQYYWDFGDGTTSTIRNPTHTYQIPSTYEVTLKIPGPEGKISTSSMFINVYDHPVASFDAAPQLVYLPDDKVFFVNHSVDATEFLWSFGDGGQSTEKNPAYQYERPGQYTVNLKVWNEYGCASDTTKESFIEARRGGFLVFPNTFAPREDINGNNSIFSVNATFRPVYQDVESFHLEIFNRWGQKVFETDDIEIGWDGKFNGELAPAGLYVWVAKGQYTSGKGYDKTGQVMILK